MTKQTDVTINGVSYDARTGMRRSAATPVAQARPAAVPQRHVAPSAVHKQTLSRTQTLNRRHVAAPVKKAVPIKKTGPLMNDITAKRSPMIQKFAPSIHSPQTSASKRPVITNDLTAPIAHPVQQAAASRVAEKRQAAPKVSPVSSVQPAPKQPAAPIPTAQEVKKSSLEKALKNSAKASKKTKKKSFFQRHPRLMSVSSASLAIVMLGGYLTYVNLPNISVRVAAAQAGIAATYPSYKPSGYSLNGPVAYSDGQVSMKFAANVGPQNFTVKQVKSSWDSSALLENYVAPSSSDDYQTVSDSGLTIYTYGNNAAWVNGGILHTIEGDASLSSEQVRKIATSM